MASRLNPYLTFGGNAREAMEFYARALDGTLTTKAVRRATITMPLEKQGWGDIFGMCTDRVGVAWMVDITQPQG